MGKRLHDRDESCTGSATGVALNIGLECNPGATPVQPLAGKWLLLRQPEQEAGRKR